jgi:hypothetical protein
MDIRLSHVELPATIYEDNILKSLTKKWIYDLYISMLESGH